MKTTLTDKEGNALDSFTIAFLEAALFTTTDESRDDGGDPLDDNYSIDDLDQDTVEALAAECARFQAENAAYLEGFDLSQAGHDFWMTRNGHGCGFWDGDWPEPQATALTRASKRYNEVYLYLGNNGEIGQ